MSFGHLHVHSEFSLLDGASRVGELAQFAKDNDQPGIALTDHGAMYGAVKFYKACNDAGVKPVLGIEAYAAVRTRHDREAEDRKPYHLILLAQNDVGWRNLITLSSRASLEGYYYKPRVDADLLAQHSEGIVCLSACLGGEVAQAILKEDQAAALATAQQYAEIFPGRYYLEVQDHGQEEDKVVNDALLAIAKKAKLPMVATQDSHYTRREDASTHDTMLCIQTLARLTDEKRFKFSGPDYYLTTTEEMAGRFARFPDAVSNAGRIIDSCDVTLPLGKALLPQYRPVPDGITDTEYLALLCKDLLPKRYPDVTPEILNRLYYELEVICASGFASYFLVIWDLVRAARCDGVRVGPGRGSAAGSLVAYVLGITNICPIRHGLIFERFLTMERKKMPDIDLDFDSVGRDRVIRYAQAKYGSDHVAQVATIGTLAARSAVRSVARVHSMPVEKFDALSKLIPFSTFGTNLQSTIDTVPEFRRQYKGEDDVRTVVDTSLKLEGVARNVGTHAAGIIVSPVPLMGLVPLRRPSSGDVTETVSQLEMDDLQELGLLKVDLLGLSNLTVIDETVKLIASTRGEDIDIDALPEDDQKVYDLLCRGDTHGIFQLDSYGGRKVITQIQPKTLGDIAVAIALNRPGPIEGKVVDLYVSRRRGKKDVEYLLPELEPILEETHGTIIYQDQVMQIASAVAGYTLGEADMFREAMGKKDRQKMAAQRKRFLQRAQERGVDDAKAVELFDLLSYFVGYGFGKAHAYSYAAIAYQTAWLKTHYPVSYYCALLASRQDDYKKLPITMASAKSRGIEILPPDIHESMDGFTITPGGIRHGLLAVKGFGTTAYAALVEGRQAGPFQDINDVAMRCNIGKLNKGALEALIRAGACRDLGSPGDQLINLEETYKLARKAKAEAWKVRHPKVLVAKL